MIFKYSYRIYYKIRPVYCFETASNLRNTLSANNKLFSIINKGKIRLCPFYLARPSHRFLEFAEDFEKACDKTKWVVAFSSISELITTRYLFFCKCITSLIKVLEHIGTHFHTSVVEICYSS